MPWPDYRTANRTTYVMLAVILVLVVLLTLRFARSMAEFDEREANFGQDCTYEQVGCDTSSRTESNGRRIESKERETGRAD